MANPVDKSLLDAVSAIATLVTPVLLAALGGIGWLIQHKIGTSQAKQDAQTARIRELEDKLHEDRITTYNALLEPFFLLFTSGASFAQDKKYKGKRRMTSPYPTCFPLSTGKLASSSLS